MKIYLLALLGLAAGGAVKTISTSSTSDSTVAAPPDSSAPLAASSDTTQTTVSPPGSTIPASPTISTPSTSPTSSPSSIGSIGSTNSTNSSTSSPTAPAGDDNRDIAVSMTFTVEGIDNGSDDSKEMSSNIKKSVADTLDRVLGTEVTMNKIAVVEAAPAGRRLGSGDKYIQVDYTLRVSESFEEATKDAVVTDDFKNEFTKSLTHKGTKVQDGKVVESVILCSDVNPATNGFSDGTLTCQNDFSVCVVNCNTTYKKSSGGTAHKCDGNVGQWVGNETCVKRTCDPNIISNGSYKCDKIESVLTTEQPPTCSLKCDLKYYQKTVLNSLKCIDDNGDTDAKWSGGVGECALITCDKSNISGAPTDGTLDCDAAENDGSVCKLGCTDGTFHIEEETTLRCGGVRPDPQNELKPFLPAGKWIGQFGKCVKNCGADGDICQDKEKQIGTCDAGSACIPNKATGPCKAGGPKADGDDCSLTAKAKTLSGKCKSEYCVHEKFTDVKMVVKVPMSETDIGSIEGSATLKAQFKARVKDAILELATHLGVKDKHVTMGTVTGESRRLQGQFLQDATPRMLQVEYSVQVSQSAAAEVKAALDTLMHSSNLT